MSDNKTTRKDFLKGAAMGLAGGSVAAMALYSYSPLRKNHFAKKVRKQEDIGVCKSIKVTNISETSWFENSALMVTSRAPADCWSTSTTTTGRPSETARDLERDRTRTVSARSNTSFPKGSRRRGTSPRSSPCIPKMPAVSRAWSSWRPWTGKSTNTFWTPAGHTSGWRSASSVKASTRC